MARVKVHTLCGLPLDDCVCDPDEDDEPGGPEPDGGSGGDEAA